MRPASVPVDRELPTASFGYPLHLVDLLSWTIWASPPVTSVAAAYLFFRAVPLARRGATVRRARSIRLGAWMLLLLGGIASYGSFVALVLSESAVVAVDFELSVSLLVVGAWWGFFSGAAFTPLLGQKSDLDMTSAVVTTRVGLTLLFALGLALVGALVGGFSFGLLSVSLLAWM